MFRDVISTGYLSQFHLHIADIISTYVGRVELDMLLEFVNVATKHVEELLE